MWKFENPKMSRCTKTNEYNMPTRKQKELRAQAHSRILDANRLLFDEKYDCSRVEVTGNITSKVILGCPVHGWFQKEIRLFLAGTGCKLCGSENKKVTLARWKERASRIHNNKYDYSQLSEKDFKYSKMKGPIVCKEHGTFVQSLKNHLSGTGCPKCSQKIAKKQKHPKQKHICDASLAKLKNPDWLYDQNYHENKTLSTIASELGTTVSTVWSRFNQYGIKTKHFFVSSGEQEIVNFLSELGVNVKQSDRTTIPPYELDILLPDYKIAIEFNGNYWHTENNGGKDKYYHKRKTQRCLKVGIQLLHIFENDWLTKQKIVLSRLAHILKKNNNRKIYARNTDIRLISAKDKKQFLNENHMYGDCRSSLNYGLFYDDELFSVMTFGAARFTTSCDFELIRYAPKINTSVVGGASKLFTAFVKSHKNASIISYADCKWSTGSVYKTLGFKFKGYTAQPNYVYVRPPDFTPLSRHAFQKHKLKDVLEYFDPKLTEWENMKLNRYDRIWDAGHMIWMYNLDV